MGYSRSTAYPLRIFQAESQCAHTFFNNKWYVFTTMNLSVCGGRVAMGQNFLPYFDLYVWPLESTKISELNRLAVVSRPARSRWSNWHRSSRGSCVCVMSSSKSVGATKPVFSDLTFWYRSRAFLTYLSANLWHILHASENFWFRWRNMNLPIRTLVIISVEQ